MFYSKNTHDDNDYKKFTKCVFCCCCLTVMWAQIQEFQRFCTKDVVYFCTYNCEQTFSLMKLNKSNLIVWMTGEHLASVFPLQRQHLYQTLENVWGTVSSVINLYWFLRNLKMWRVSSSGIWRRVVRWVAPDVSPDYTASYPRRWYYS
jgi:hypothetical protein